MKGTAETLESIRELNLSYLMLAQRLLKEDVSVAKFRLGLSQETADILGNLTLAQTIKLASGSTLLCAFRMTDRALLSGLAEKISFSALAATHQAILAAGQEPLETVSA